MKHRILALLAVITILITSCNKDLEIISLTLEVSKTKILNDSEDAVFVLVTDQEQRDVTSRVTLNFAGEVVDNMYVTGSDAGIFPLTANYGSIVSNTVQITVVEDPGLKFNKNVLIEQFTNNACPWCPKSIESINNVMAVRNDIIHVAYHLDVDFFYSQNTELFFYFGFEVTPSMAANREYIWDGYSSNLPLPGTGTMVGISMDVSGNIDAITADVRIEFGKVFAAPVKLCLYLVEDGLIADQQSAFNNDPGSVFYQMGEVLENFMHHNVMIASFTDIYGELIPSSQIDIGSVYEKTFVVNPPETIEQGSPWITDIQNCKVVAVLTHGPEEIIAQAVNSLSCSMGQSSSNGLLAGK